MDIAEMTDFDLARGLMRGDAETFKAGYSLANAVFAVADIRQLDKTQAADLRVKLIAADLDGRADGDYGRPDRA